MVYILSSIVVWDVKNLILRKMYEFTSFSITLLSHRNLAFLKADAAISSCNSNVDFYSLYRLPICIKTKRLARLLGVKKLENEFVRPNCSYAFKTFKFLQLLKSVVSSAMPFRVPEYL